jgi:small-conductance mechanosensitive channel
MELRPITNAVTKTIVIVVFWVVLLIDLILSPIISFREIAFALIKAVVISGVFWLLFAMLVDTFLKTILLDAKEKKADRIDGGLSYHVTEPNAEEVAWLKAQEKEEKKNGP